MSVNRSAFPIVLSLSPIISRELDGREVGHAYQARCVAAWQACGFRVITVNAASEVPQIRAFYPDVEIAVAARDMSALCGKPLVPLAEMVAILCETGSPVGGIVNSDVFLPAWDMTGWLADCLGPARLADCLFLNRQDLSHPASATGTIYKYGFDAFFFRLAALEEISLDPFTIGLPWWDYYLPMALILKGFRVANIERIPLRHFAHSQKWTADSWDYMFEVFRERLRDQFVLLEKKRGLEMPALTALVEQDQMTRRASQSAGGHGAGGPVGEVGRLYREAYSASVADLIFQLSGMVSAPIRLGARWQ